MIVHCFPADDFGCGFYRIGAPAQVLQNAGHQVIIHPASANRGLDIHIDTASGRVVDCAPPPGADVVVLQRIVSRKVAAAIPHLRRRGVAVVVDMDDDLGRLDPRNPAYLGMHPKHSGREDTSWANAQQVCESATMVTVSTPALDDRYGRRGNGRVLFNRIPAVALTYPRDDSGDIGWAGTVYSHPNDLPVVGTAVTRLVNEGIHYRGVGPAAGVREAFRLIDEPEVTGSLPIDQWLKGVATMGVGMAPLADTDFNAAKSWLKVLEMSAVGVPWVASPRVEYRRFHTNHGVGLLAERPKDWYRALKRLATSPELRAEQSALGRAAAANNTYEDHAWRWWEAWSDALQLQRRTRPVLGRV